VLEYLNDVGDGTGVLTSSAVFFNEKSKRPPSYVAFNFLKLPQRLFG
jgi:hypothetical protein